MDGLGELVRGTLAGEPAGEVLGRVTDLLRQELQVDHVEIHRVEPAGLRLAARSGAPGQIPDALARLCLQRGEPVLDDPGPARVDLLQAGLPGAWAVPIPGAGSAVGVVCAARGGSGNLEPTARAGLVAFAQAAGLALEVDAGRDALRACQEEVEDLELRGGRRAAPEEANMAGLSRMARQLGHDLRGPLANLRVALDLLRGSDPADQERLLDRLDREIAEASRLIADRVHLTRSLEPSTGRSGLGAVVRQAAMELRRPHDVKVELDVDEAPTVEGDADLLSRMLVLLAENSVEALVEGGTIRMSARAVDGMAELRVEDSGPGIPGALRSKVCVPGFTTRERGSGLGLAVCRRTAAAHGGTLEIAESADLGGAAVIVRLPAL